MGWFGKKKEIEDESVSPILVEGGDFKCFIHGFTTSDIGVWDKHCIETKHVISGVTRCPFCNESVEFRGAPYNGIGKVPKVVCEKCKGEIR